MRHTYLAIAIVTVFIPVQYSQQSYTATTLPTGDLMSESGPTFKIDDTELSSEPVFIAYGDQRFTDPTNVKATDPRVREWLVRHIAENKPAAIVLNGDVPLAGDVKNDYAVFKTETKPWYSAQVGSRFYVLALDSDTSLLPGSDQARWISKQIEGFAASVDFVLLTMHHPPVADIQAHIEVGHNPRPNEIALREYLSEAAKRSHARFVVSAGHIHNYERNIHDNVVYLVSGGGGAKPYYGLWKPNIKVFSSRTTIM